MKASDLHTRDSVKAAGLHTRDSVKAAGLHKRDSVKAAGLHTRDSMELAFPKGRKVGLCFVLNLFDGGLRLVWC